MRRYCRVRSTACLLGTLLAFVGASPADVSGQESNLIGTEIARIGVVFGDSLLEFFRVADIDFLGDSALVIANGRAPYVRIVGLDGTVQRAFARSGSGPGEIRSVRRGGVHIVGDSVWVFDSRLQRVSVWSLEAGLGRTTPLRGSGPVGLLWLVGVFPDRSLLVMTTAPRLAAPDTVGWMDEGATLVHAAPDGRPLRTLGTVLWKTEFAAWQTTTPGVRGWASWTPPGTHESTVVVTGASFLYTDGAAPRVTERDASGDTLSEVDVAVESPWSISENWDHALDGWRSDLNPEFQRRLKDAKVPPPPVVPRGVSRLVADGRGNWIYTGQEVVHGNKRIWHWVPSTGSTARVELPEDYDLFAIRGDLVAGVERDTMGVEYVTVLQLQGVRHGREGVDQPPCLCETDSARQPAFRTADNRLGSCNAACGRYRRRHQNR